MKIGKIVKKVILSIIVIAVICVIGIVGFFTVKGYTMYKQAVNSKSIEAKVAEIETKENYTKLTEVPVIYKNAVVAVEDHRFYKHCGVDIISISRAIYQDVKNKSLVEGGSTITQQLGRNMYFTQEKSFVRKIAEVFVAFDIERHYSKDTILELYMNISYYGDGCDTVKEASRHYFNKESNEMSDYEATLIAGIPNAPSAYSPTKNLELAEKRQKQVLNKLVKYDYISQNFANKIENEKN